MQTTQVYAVNRDTTNCLQVRTTELPPPPPGQVRVRVEAAGVSYGDLLFQRGVVPGGPKPPFIPGCDLVGVVDAVGDGVTDLPVGQRVAALVVSGGWAGGAILPAERLVPVPDGVTAENAAAVALNYFIAHQMLHRVGNVTSGSRILVHGASGGVGLALLQLAEHIGGVTVFGSASAKNLDVVRRHGAIAIDYRAQDFMNVVRDNGGTVDVAYDPIGGTQFIRSYSVLRRGGQLVAYGQNDALRNGKSSLRIGAVGFLAGIAIPKIIPDGRRTGFYNAWALEKTQPHAYREDLAQVLSLAAADKISVRELITIPLTDADEALRRVEAGVAGKIVLTA